MEKLVSLPNISRLNEALVRVLGQNPGKFTLQGTNTYLLGRQRPFILVDTGEGRESYVPLLETALREVDACTASRESSISSSLIGDIILTHRHHDHCNGLPSILELICRLWQEGRSTNTINDGNDLKKYRPPRVHKYPLPSYEPDQKLQGLLDRISTEIYSKPSPPAAPIIQSDAGNTGIGILHDLYDGQTIAASGISLTVIHTPGHTTDSICLLSETTDEQNNSEYAIFTGDTVLGQGTSVFEDLGAYMKSLQRLMDKNKLIEGGFNYSRLYPGHGPVVEDGPSLIATYMQHRIDRENEILQILRNRRNQSASGGDSKHGTMGSIWTAWDIAKVIYKDYSESLWLPASQSVVLHLRKLEDEGRVRRVSSSDDGDDIRQRWELVQSKM